MDIESARLAYVPFKRMPAGHVFIVFRLHSGEEMAISPEADLKLGMSFSLVRGLRKTYPLRYLVQPPEKFLERYRLEDRNVREYPLNLSTQQLKVLYQKMLDRANSLERQNEWYHTLFNSCVTNMIRHIDEIKAQKRSWLSYGRLILAPIQVSNL